jgi:hypothetical protein
MKTESSKKQNRLAIQVKDLWIKTKSLLDKLVIWLSTVPMLWLAIVVLCLGVYMWRVSYLQSKKADQIRTFAAQTATAGKATAAAMPKPTETLTITPTPIP